MRLKHPTTHLLVLLALCSYGAACGGASDGKQDGGKDSDAPPMGVGGQAQTGGATGTSVLGGNLGSGGRATAGSTGGATIGSGGATRGDGGATTGGLPGNGGRATGGVTGSGGHAGAAGMDGGPSDGARDQAKVDARAEVPRDGLADTPLDLGMEAAADVPFVPDSPAADTSVSGTLDSCFVGLPAQVGVQMIATKSSADGKVRMRIALDTEDRMGTSGTFGWGLIRLAVEVDGVVTCITDRSALDYFGSHHNCDDTATATSGTTTYSIVAPDRPTATLTIAGGSATAGPFSLSDTACTMFWSPGTPITCRSGGSC